MSTSQQIAYLEEQKEAQKGFLKLSKHLEALRKNRDFKALFEVELFKVFAAECVLAKGDPSLQDEKNQRPIDADIAMIGALNSRLQVIHAMGINAEPTIASLDLEIERLASGADEDEFVEG